MKELIAKAKEVQEMISRKQKELERQSFDGESGGGMVRATVNGKLELTSLSIDPSIVSADDIEMLEDLIVAAINTGYKKANKAMQDEFSGMMGGLGNLKNLLT